MKSNEITKLLSNDPLWYRAVYQEIENIKAIKNNRKRRSLKHTLLKITKRALKEGTIILGNKWYNWDQHRLPIDTIVLHHTSSSPTISLLELSAVELLNLYVKQYMTDEDVKDQKIFSGHYYLNKPEDKNAMTFTSYHYLIRPGGKVTKIVEDSAFLWHAGNLDINKRSIAIAFAGKFINGEKPSKIALEVCAKLIKETYGFIQKDRIFGHCEVIRKDILGETICPGESFISNWKQRLLKLI
ncbi:hypothetical protein A2716_03495 [candidate division WWE3 bacterium RIFCSPHIGHO2_01_FULL_40_23]|uniref:N-acetylmuramoyl-L-alanine amidase n=1 Tax=candidate division WWE3 bacterium RIFCSPLOWO2_01_FULL_41_18 TaxID=1802625 RepID=A0A1F4VCQ4_UNCKA|nr:MAG: hypothetical protein A2716_03495 [candidate division WWE3 bacterium RIFCSPHIGHO2_01_FULL_40_23]OGC54944.1 MAG: hypothetical protein A3A78_03105 [candidate division WWE3 bacterium RIFCSPLOWO2_01_FULL_41_18]